MPEIDVVGKLARALSAGGVYSAWISLNEMGVAETLAREDFDTVVLDMQHGGVDFVGASRGITRKTTEIEPRCRKALTRKRARPSTA